MAKRKRKPSIIDIPEALFGTVPQRTEVTHQRVAIDIPVSVTVVRGEPLLHVGDLSFPITRAKAWALLFGADEEMEEILKQSGVSRITRKISSNHVKATRSFDKPSESTGVINRKKRNARGLCGRKDCSNKHPKGSMWCLKHLREMRATAAAARAKKVKKS